jgi:plastocyanin
MIRSMIVQCTRVQRFASRGALYFSLLALVVLAGCGTAAGATTGGTTGAAPTATTAPTTPAATATPSTPANATTVTITGASGNFAFQPASVTVKAGATVMWVNNSNVAHTTTSDSSSAVSWDSSAISTGGGSFSFVFSKPGTYTYHCSFHPFMHGTIVVTA